MPVRLRGHHFLCILTYKGAGYSAPFVANMSEKVAMIAAGAPVTLVEGPDDICNGFTEACRVSSGHDCNARETVSMDRMATGAVSQILKRSLERPAPLSGQEIAGLREAFKCKTIRAACTDCSWKEFCDGIAETEFTGTEL